MTPEEKIAALEAQRAELKKATKGFNELMEDWNKGGGHSPDQREMVGKERVKAETGIHTTTKAIIEAKINQRTGAAQDESPSMGPSGGFKR